MKFRIGQRVEFRGRHVPGAQHSAEDRARDGKRGCVAAFGAMYPPSAFTRWQVRFDDGDYCDPIEECLHPIDDLGEYERFMERVLKPIPEPVSA